MNEQFYTLKGYDHLYPSELSPTMEDYLEMIYRHVTKEQFMRVNALAAKLNVTPPAASKMVNKLKEMDYVSFEPYGYIRLTKKGLEKGAYLLHRHNILHQLFCLINGTNQELTTVERIEHFIDETTIQNIEKFIKKIENQKEPP